MVELLLENYHRQLVLVGHDVATMKQEIESVQVRDVSERTGAYGSRLELELVARNGGETLLRSRPLICNLVS